jgi:hypothetical protein
MLLSRPYLASHPELLLTVDLFASPISTCTLGSVVPQVNSRAHLLLSLSIQLSLDCVITHCY